MSRTIDALPIICTDTTDTLTLGTGALIISGGGSIAKKLFVGETITLNSSIISNAANFSITGGSVSLSIQPNGTGNINLVTTGAGRATVSFPPVAANDIANKNYVDTTRIMSYSYATSTTSYIEINSTATYTVVSQFIFLGSATVGTPSSILLLACMAATVANRRMRWRIFDVTNGLTICQSATTNSNAFAIINMGAISNVPTGQAIFQLQQQDTDNTNTPSTHATNGRIAGLLLQ